MIPVRRLNEKLCLIFSIHTLLQCFQFLGTFPRFNRQITMKRKALPVKARSHHGKNNWRGSNQRNYLQFFTLCDGNHIRSRIGYRRTTGFGDNSHWSSAYQRLQITGNIFRWSMFVQRIKCQRININLPVHLFQETTGRTNIFDYKIPDTGNNFLIIRRQHLFNRCIA